MELSRSWRCLTRKRAVYAIMLVALIMIVLATLSLRQQTFQMSQLQQISNVFGEQDVKQTYTTSSADGKAKSCQPVKLTPIEHIYYLKIHKTGSTTVYSILAEYCREHELLPLLPLGNHINQFPPFRSNQVMLDPNVRTYDMVFNHHVFSPNILKYLHNDTFVFTTLREPFKQMVSSFQYFKNEGGMAYLNRIRGDDPVREYLAHRHTYEAKGYASYTNNRQSMDLGYDLGHSFDDNKYIDQFIALTDRRFDLVLITDYFHESLVVLKRRLNWNTGNILYYKKNARRVESRFEDQNKSMTIPQQQHARYSQADITLYNAFLRKFKHRMDQERDLQGEVSEFENVLAKVHAFCDTSNTHLKRLDIPAGRWTDPVHIFQSRCKWLMLGEDAFTKYLKSRQSKLLHA